MTAENRTGIGGISEVTVDTQEISDFEPNTENEIGIRKIANSNSHPSCAICPNCFY